MPRDALIQFRAGTAAAWASVNPILAAGEPSFELDTGVQKIGDGTTAYNSLAASGGSGGGSQFTSVLGKASGTVAGSDVLTDAAVAAALTAKAPLASPSLTGTPTAPTASGGTNTTQVATTAFVEGEIATKAPLASPALTGTPTVPTAAVDTSTTQAASTAFVVAQAASVAPLIDGTAAVGTSTRYARGDHRHPTDTTRAAAAITVTAGTGLTGGGDLGANRTLTVSYGTTSGTSAQGNDPRVVNAVQSTTITTIVKLTQTAYDALGSPDAATLYVVVG